MDKGIKRMSWQEMYEIAKKYKEKYGNLLVIVSYITEDGVKLGIWINNQRQAYKKGELSEERIGMLNDIGMVWVAKDFDRDWQRMYEIAKKYKEKNGDLLVSRKDVTEDGVKLGIWINNQRKAKKKNKLSEERIRMLEDIGMVWVAKNLDRDWQRMYEIAKKYKEKYGNLLVPVSYITEDGVKDKLGNWIEYQRRAKKKNKLSEERIRMLEEIGIVWSVHTENWEKIYELAKKYYEENGNLLVPVSYITEDGVKLGIWINNQRKAKKYGELSEERIGMLNDIGMVWVIKDFDKVWQRMYGIAKGYRNSEGELEISATLVTKDGAKLGQWLTRQKLAYKKGILSKEKVRLLEEIGIIWEENDFDYSWYVMYELAKKYKEKYGNLLVPVSHITEDGVKLSIWIRNQKAAKKKNKLSEERIRMLEEIGIVWSVHTENWEKMYELAKKYREKYGNLLMPVSHITEDGVKLGIWIQNQKAAKKKNKLSEERIRMLEEIGIKWEENAFDYSWNVMYEHARDYRRQYGTLLITWDTKTEDGAKLGQWISLQRTTYKKGKLSEERTRKLEEIGMIWEVKKNKEDIIAICDTYNIDKKINKPILEGISALELQAKINYLISRNMQLVHPNGLLVGIFSMSSLDMKESYGLSLEEIINTYCKEDKKVRIK